jgi:3-methyladenine DNA glycosylase AlkD
MTVKEVLAQLESMGDDARRKHNTKSGAPDNQFGVKLGDIRAVAKKLKADHALALKLWETGNVEAQLLATLTLKPQSLSATEVDTMTRSTTCSQVAEWMNSYIVAQHPDKDALRDKWMKDKDRWSARAGWHLTASRVNKDGKADDLDPVALLDRIEKELPKAKPEIQWTMNNTLAAIGIKHAEHRKRAIAIGEKIGLYSDWPVSKGCIPPYVPVWIEAMVKRKA